MVNEHAAAGGSCGFITGLWVALSSLARRITFGKSGARVEPAQMGRRRRDRDRATPTVRPAPVISGSSHLLRCALIKSEYTFL